MAITIDGSNNTIEGISNTIEEDDLKVSNAGSNGQFLQKQSGNTGGLTWATVDTTVADNAITLAKMAGGTDGQIITYDASGDPVAVGPGTDGQVLTSTGAGSPPAFEDISGAKIVQIVCSHSNDGGSTNSTTFVDGGGNVSITPTKTTNKIMVIHTVQYGARAQGDHNDADIRYRWTRTVGGTETEVYSGMCRPQCAADVDNIALYITVTVVYRDDPQTTSECEYQMQHRITGSNSHMHSYLNNTAGTPHVWAIEYEEA